MADTKSRIAAYKSYIVINKKTGKEVCRGNSAKCAEIMGVKRKSFLTLASTCRSTGHGTWDIQTVEKSSAIDYDKSTMFLIREECGGEPKNPCKGCRWTEFCGDETYCKRWRQWFRYHYAAACSAVRKRVEHEAG